MFIGMRLWLLVMLLLCLQTSAFAEPDARMQVDVAAEEEGVEVQWLHANIQKAADLALPVLWNRIIPRHAMDQIPKKVKALRFLQKAVPNAQGVRIIFNEKRVVRYLKQHSIAYYAEQAADDTAVAAEAAQPARDFQPEPQALAQPQLQTGLLTIERQASLPEQVLFEDDLAHDPRVLGLTLRQVDRDRRQYRLQLKSPDDQWLTAWFGRRGMTLTQSVEGWLAR